MFDMWAGPGFGSLSIFSDRVPHGSPQVASTNNPSLERSQSENVKEEDEGLNFHLPNMDLDELE